MQNYLKTFIGLFALLLLLVLNLTYASRGYGLHQVYADEEETETLPDNTYECDTQDEKPVYCNAREKTGTRAILCPYYKVTFYAKYQIKFPDGTISEETLKDGPYGSFSDLVFLRTPSFEIPSDSEVIQEWAERQTDYMLVREALIECEYVAEPDNRCSPLHKCCSDFVSDGGSGVYEEV